MFKDMTKTKRTQITSTNASKAETEYITYKLTYLCIKYSN